MTGRQIGHYEVLDKLGEGGMGEVYLAEDTTLKRRVALKVLSPELAGSQERLERFQREAESLATLNHPNIVTVYTVEADQGVHFLTMELVEGEQLGRLIPEHGLPLERFFDLALPLADALAEAHEQGVIHRDLKPSNIMVDRKGRPKILDFGLAKLRLPEASAEQLSQAPTKTLREEDRTAEGVILGTYPYMSPEQVEGKRVDHRSDLFSLGVVLYQMATGHKPFGGDSPISIMSAILKEEPPAVDVDREELPHHLSRIINRCLAKDPADRYQRAGNLKNDLEELRHEVQTGVSGGWAQKGKQEEQRSWARLGAVVVVLLAVALGLYWLRPWERDRPPEPETTPRITSLAVLPLENLSGDPEQDYYATGITEGLIADLGRISALRVISRQSVMRYKGSDKPLPDIAAELGVEALIEGSVLTAGDRVRVTAQLVQADPERHLWADTYERDAGDILALLSEVTRAITTEVRVVVSREEREHLAAPRRVDPEAHRAYLLGQNAWRRGTPAEVAKAAEYFRQAVEIDATYALAWTGLAGYHLGLEIWGLPLGAEDVRRMSSLEADAAIQKALELEDSSSEAHMFMGWVEWFRNWDWAAAEKEFQRAIEINPNDSDLRLWYARFLSAMGRPEEAGRENRFAETLDPLSALVHRVWGDLHYFAGDFEASLQSYDRSLELDPEHLFALGMKGMVLTAMGRLDEAMAVWLTYRRLIGQEALAESLEGKTWEEATRIVGRAMRDPAFVNSGPAMLAGVHASIGEYEAALGLLEEAYSTKDDRGKAPGWTFTYLKVDPLFEPLHSDPRFKDLLRRMNLAD